MPVGVGHPAVQHSTEGDAVGVVVAATASGSLELVTLQRGLLTPLTATVSISLSNHPSSPLHRVSSSRMFQTHLLTSRTANVSSSATGNLSMACRCLNKPAHNGEGHVVA